MLTIFTKKLHHKCSTGFYIRPYNSFVPNCRKVFYWEKWVRCNNFSHYFGRCIQNPVKHLIWSLIVDSHSLFGQNVRSQMFGWVLNTSLHFALSQKGSITSYVTKWYEWILNKFIYIIGAGGELIKTAR